MTKGQEKACQEAKASVFQGRTGLLKGIAGIEGPSRCSSERPLPLIVTSGVNGFLNARADGDGVRARANNVLCRSRSLPNVFSFMYIRGGATSGMSPIDSFCFADGYGDAVYVHRHVKESRLYGKRVLPY